jgi:uncharacterized membrane protein YfcA
VIGVAGAAFGSMLGKQIDGKQLLFLFAILMIVVGVLMLRRNDKGTQVAGAISPASTRNVSASSGIPRRAIRCRSRARRLASAHCPASSGSAAGS